jgi:hypothetical protein
MLQNQNNYIMDKSFEDNFNSLCQKEPIEIVQINTPIIIDNLAMRKSLTRNIALIPATNTYHPMFCLEGIEDYKILNINMISKAKLDNESCLKKIELLVNVSYNLIYSDGKNTLSQPDCAAFELKIDGIKYPDCTTKCFSSQSVYSASNMSCKGNLSIKIDCIAEHFGEIICPCTGALIVDIGVFFIIKSECVSQLSLPSLGFCEPHDFCIKQ